MSVVVANPKNANEVSFDTQQRLLEQQKQEEEELRQKARKSPFSNFYQVNEVGELIINIVNFLLTLFYLHQSKKNDFKYAINV